MCGSTNLLKQDGVFVCQSCGTKYSVEEAKKMMLEGTVNVKGTIKVDKSDEFQNLLKLAQAAIDSVNGEEAYAYANRALEADPENAQAWLLKMKAVNLTAILKDLKVLDVIKAGNQAIKLNPKYAKEVYEFYLVKMLNDLKFCMNQLNDTTVIKNLYEANCSVNAFKASQNTLAADTICNLILTQIDIVVKLRNMIPNSVVSEDSEIARLVGEVAKQWVYYTKAVNDRFNVYALKVNDETVAKYRSILARIKQGLPAGTEAPISEEEISNPSKGPCYVATAVYGSYDCPEVWTLRRFRDYTLAGTWYGRAFISTYYAISPTFVKWFGKSAWFKTLWQTTLDKLVTRLQEKGVENTPYNDREW